MTAWKVGRYRFGYALLTELGVLRFTWSARYGAFTLSASWGEDGPYSGPDLHGPDGAIAAGFVRVVDAGGPWNYGHTVYALSDGVAWHA